MPMCTLFMILSQLRFSFTGQSQKLYFGKVCKGTIDVEPRFAGQRTGSGPTGRVKKCDPPNRPAWTFSGFPIVDTFGVKGEPFCYARLEGICNASKNPEEFCSFQKTEISWRSGWNDLQTGKIMRLPPSLISAACVFWFLGHEEEKVSLLSAQ